MFYVHAYKLVVYNLVIINMPWFFFVKFSGMPTYPYLYGDDLVDVLKKKHAAGTYKSLVPDQFIGYFCFALLL
jgi:hypothetical protein